MASAYSWMVILATTLLFAGAGAVRAQEVLYVLPVQDNGGANEAADDGVDPSAPERFLRPGADGTAPARRPFWQPPPQRSPRLFSSGRRLFPTSRPTVPDIGRDLDNRSRSRRLPSRNRTVSSAARPAAPPVPGPARASATAFPDPDAGRDDARLSGEADISGGNRDIPPERMAPVARAANMAGSVPAGVAPAAVRPANDGITTGSIVDVNDRLRPDFTAPGLRMGSMILRPSVGVHTEYTDNVTQAKQNRTSDVRLRIMPELRLDSDWSRHSLGLRLGGEVVRHKRKSTEDYVSLNATLTGRVDIRRDLSIDGEVSFSADQEARDSADIASTAIDRPFYYTTLARLGLTKSFNRLSLNLRGTLARTDYTDARLAGGGSSNNDDRDMSDYTLVLRGTYEFGPRLRTYVEGEYSRRRYDQRRDDAGVARGSYGLGAVAGATYEITRLLRGDVALGYGARNYEDSSLKDIGYVNMAAAIYWNVRPHLTLRGAFTTTVEETTVAGASAALSRELVFGADMDVRRDLRMGGELRLTDRRYSGTSIREQDYDLKVTAEYFINRNVSVTAEVGHGGTRSNQAGSGYRENRISMGFRLKL